MGAVVENGVGVVGFLEVSEGCEREKEEEEKKMEKKERNEG